MEATIQKREGHHREKMAKALSQEQHECHRAFITCNYEQHKNINPNAAEGTCRWIFENSQYLAWLESSHNDLLWISADPGCGKSVLAKSLIDEHLGFSSDFICYFFFKDNEEQNSVATALCAILHQLFSMQPHLLQHALPPWEKNSTKIQQEVDELWRILEAAVFDPASSRTICILDALDECRPHDQIQLIKMLQKLYTKTRLSNTQNWLKFLVTSRPYDEIRQGFYPATQSFPNIHVRGEEENERIHEEISMVVRMRVKELGEHLDLLPETQQQLEQKLLSMEHRTYLWLHLPMDDIRTMFHNSLRPEKESIQLIPNSVSDAYQKILGRVPPSRKSVVKMILQIIIGARRPLTIEEMAMALGMAQTPNARLAAQAGLGPKGLDAKIRHLCGLFVFINNSRIYLIHQTAREFLVRSATQSQSPEWSFEHASTEALVSDICINYLLLDDIYYLFLHHIDGTLPESGTVILPSLLEYSALYWPDHVREMPLSAEKRLEAQLDQLYDVDSEKVQHWFSFFWRMMGRPFEPPPTMSLIRLAAWNGHGNVLKRQLLKSNDGIDETDPESRSGLFWASQNGYAVIVQQLLQAGADINIQSYVYDDALRAAAKEDFQEVVQELLQAGAVINARDSLGRTVLFIASRYGCHSMVNTLLSQEQINPNIKDWCSSTPLFAAVANGHLRVVELLLAGNKPLDGQQLYFGRSLLWWARHADSPETVDFLLQHISKTNSPLHNDGIPAAVSGFLWKGSAWCDACTVCVPQGNAYTCRECGGFCFCGECFNKGIRCLESGHTYGPR